MILVAYILIEIVLVVILVLLSKFAIEFRRESKREPSLPTGVTRELSLPTGMTIEKKSDKIIYTFHYDDEHSVENRWLE